MTEALARVEAELAGVRLGELHAALGSVRTELAALEASSSGVHGARHPAARVPSPWLAQDPADSLYREARAALNRGDYTNSARLFGSIRESYPSSGYAADSFYFQALALQRAGGTARLRDASGLLDRMLEEHPEARTATEARALRVRIQGALARQGDAGSAMEVAEQATQACEGDGELRAAALSALLQMDPDQARPILLEVLEERGACSAELRKRAVFILSQNGEPDAETVDLLVDLAQRDPDPDPEVREAAVFWLSQVDTPEALDALASILDAPDVDTSLQEKAIFAVSQHDGDRAGQILRDYATRPDAPTELRGNAIFWLGENDALGGVDFLRDLYARVEEPELRERVIFAVAQSDEPGAGEWLMERVRDATEPMEVRKNALFWAGEAHAADTGDLTAIYRSVGAPEMKEQVIFVLSQQDGSEAVDALMEIVEAEEDTELRKKALFWLGQSDDPRVADFLLQILRSGP
jgi:HEAT repeat protein